MATATFADDNALWLVWSAGGYVSAAKSGDQGRSFGPRKVLNKEALNIDWGPDARPKIVVAKDGRIAITFTVLQDKAFNGRVFYVASKDGGETFSEPAPITADNESQRFEALALDSDGKVFLTWLDKRNRPAAKAKGEKYAGAALAFAWADAGNASRRRNAPCCRQHLRMLPDRGGLRRAWQAGYRLPQHLRGQHPRSRGHDLQRSAYAWAGQARQRGQLEDRGLPPSRAKRRHLGQRQISRRVVHGGTGPEGNFLRKLRRCG